MAGNPVYAVEKIHYSAAFPEELKRQCLPKSPKVGQNPPIPKGLISRLHAVNQIDAVSIIQIPKGLNTFRLFAPDDNPVER